MNSENPARLALKLLSWFCPDNLYEEIEGDLIQYFHEDVKLFGERKAKRRMLWSAIRFFRPGILLRNKFSIQLNKIDMLISHLKFAIRLFSKDKFFSTLNVLGLALGIAVSIILLLVLQYDLKYDQHYANHERIYRLGAHIHSEGVDLRVARSARQLCEVVKDELPEVEAATRINVWGKRGSTLVSTEYNGLHVALNEPAILRTDSDYFKVFTHEFISGDPKTCFKHVNSVVITQSTAKRFFGEVDPIGKSFQIGPNDKSLWPVTGVIKDLPGNTHLKFNILLSGIETVNAFRPGVDPIRSEGFWNPAVYVYMLMPLHYNTQDFYNKWPDIYDKYFKAFGDKLSGTYSPILQPLDEIHFHSDLDRDEAIGNIVYLYAFTGIGIFIVLLACINYMNLSTAKSAKRASEIGMKKALGSGKRLLAIAFLGESIFLSLVSLVLAVMLVFTVLNVSSFNTLIARNLIPDFLHNPSLLWGSLIIALLFGLAAGLYPALYLPSIPTVSALKGSFKSSRSTLVFRKVLISTQFILSIFVVVCTIFMQNQIEFMRNKDMGFDKDNIVVIPVTDSEEIQKQIGSLENEFLRNPKIMDVTRSSGVLGWSTTIGETIIQIATDTGNKQNTMMYLDVTENYLKTMDIKILKGRDFRQGPDTDIDYFMICNEAAAKMLGFENDPVGKKIRFTGNDRDTEIIGIVKDFNFSSLHNAIEPMVIFKENNPGGFLHLKVSGDHLPETMAYINKTWASFANGIPLEYFFLDQRFDEQYKSDETQSQLLTALSYICIFISFLGIVGLSAFTAAQRTKEIGIRKVLGANIPKIIALLSREVLVLVLISSLIVIPISYWAMMKWLQNFAYQIQLNYFLYLIVMLIALSFVFLTVLFQSLKTARSNPIDSLKYE